MASGTLSADGQTASTVLKSGLAYASNDFGGGTLTLQAYDGENDVWVPVTDGTLTSAGVIGFEFPFATTVRLSLAGSTTPTLDWSITGN